MCDQQRLRPACAYAQNDQSLYKPLEYSMTVKLLTEHHLEFLSLKGGCTGSSESTLVKMPHCWKSRVSAHICSLPLMCDIQFWVDFGLILYVPVNSYGHVGTVSSPNHIFSSASLTKGLTSILCTYLFFRW